MNSELPIWELANMRKLLARPRSDLTEGEAFLMEYLRKAVLEIDRLHTINSELHSQLLASRPSVIEALPNTVDDLEKRVTRLETFRLPPPYDKEDQ